MTLSQKKLLIWVLAGILTLGVALGVVGCGLFVKVAATVGGEKITVEQVDKAIKRMAAENPKSLTLEHDEQARLQVLNTLIYNVLYRKEAVKLGIKVTDSEVEEVINRARKRFRSEADFTDSLKAISLTLEDYRDTVRIRLIRIAVNKQVVRKVKVTEKEVRDYYENNKEQFKARPEQAEIGFIQLRTEQEAQDVLAKIRGGMNFNEGMLKFSIDPTIQTKGIRTAFVQRGEFTRLSSQVDELAFSLPSGGVTEPVQTQVGWLLMKVYEKKAATKGTYEEVKSDIERRLKIEKWMRGAKKKARIKIYI